MKPIVNIAYFFLYLIVFISCNKFVEIDPPRTELIKTTVFQNDQTADAAMMDIYYGFKAMGWASGSVSSLTFLSTLSSDEQINYSVDAWKEFNDNNISPDNQFILSLWKGLYNDIYKTNALLEGITTSTSLTSEVKKRLEGEARFARAFCYFYLVNLWGEVPLATTTNYEINESLPKSSIADIYTFIISDLKSGEILLPADYAFAGNERVRANKWACMSLLARVYLYLKDWQKAESEASAVIENTELYNIENDLNNVFLTTSTEAILQWWSNTRPNDRITFRTISDPPFYAAYRPEFATSFETGDMRSGTWMSFNLGYYNARKYKTVQDNMPLEYSTVLRLAEQYLIRAEARAQQDKLTEAVEDLSIIRNRAFGYSNPVIASDKNSMLQAIENERKWELFSEWGHRWLDLKRTGRAGDILSSIKGTSWQNTDQLYPIPTQQIQNSSLSQNMGY